MGQSLPKAVTSIVLEEDAGPLFRLGSAEMNGHRPSMEDAHVALMRDSWGFFGVFDGHGGQQCSAFVARRLTEELSKMDLPDNDAVKSLMLRIDAEFLETKQPSGSTGTFAFAIPSTDGKTVELRVGNIGDSRVLPGRADGTIVEGPGTDGGLTTDHKPDHPVEVERIERTGGTVQTIMGVPRVNGDLAVSRAFGDSQHKQTGGPKQEDHPVSVEPEFTTLTCDRTDFLVLVCDGISEGSFPNREVVQLAAEELKSKEPAQAAASVCRRALDRGSMDNLSCMIVCFDGKSETKGRVKDLVPGPFTEATHGGFRKAYAAMAERAGMPLEAAVERRYDDISKLDEEASRHGAKENGSSADAKPKEENGQSWAKLLWPMRSMEQGLEDTDSALRELRSELRNFGAGPPKKLAPGSKERTAWFKEWLEGLEVEGGKDPSTMSRDELLNWVEEDPQVLAMARAQGWVGPRAMRRVRIVDADKLRPAIEAHSVIQWDDRLLSVCGQVGKVLQDDETDNTSQVKFRGKVSASVWLPIGCLIDEEPEPPRKVRVAPLEALKAAVEENPMLSWKDGMQDLAGQLAIAMKEEPELQLTELRFPPPISVRAWLPNAVLEDLEGPARDLPLEDIMESAESSEDDDDLMLEDADALRDAYIPSVEKVKAAVEASENLEWEDTLPTCCEQKAEVLMDHPSGTSCLRVADGLVWLPTSVLEEISTNQSAEAAETAAEGENADDSSAKRQRTS